MSVTTAAEWITVAVPVGALLVAIIPHFAIVQRHILGWPLRAQSPIGRRADRPNTGERQALGRLRRGIVDAVRSGSDQDAVSILETALAQGSIGQPTRDWRGWSKILDHSLRAARARATRSLLARLLYPTESARLRDYMIEISHLVRRFAAASIVCERSVPLRSDEPGSFAHFATGFSGAVILSDAVHSRARHAERILTWHRAAYRSAQSPDTGTATYTEEHDDGGCRAWRNATRPPGDFDQLVLELRSVALAEATTEGYLAFVLETSETCYATTELSEDSPPEPGLTAIGCKNLSASLEPNRLDPRVEGVENAALTKVGTGIGRVVLLTSYVSVISSDGRLLLARRSGSVRHGANVVSASAGGVVEPSGLRADRDALGMLDPVSCAMRETMEELGLTLERGACRPVAVFLANIAGPAVSPQGTGQMVAVVLSLATVPETEAEVQALARRADPARGRFEHEGLEAIPLDSVDQVAKACLGLRDRLDQHGLLSALYTAATRWGPIEAQAAFADVFGHAPWWQTEMGSRLVRPVDTLLHLNTDGPATGQRDRD